MPLFSPKTTLKLLNYWPPFLASGISVASCNDDLTDITVRMALRPYNNNYFGTHFGGSLYSMCDPFYMFMLLEHLKAEHIVWDQAAKITFVKPGKGVVTVRFVLTLEEINDIRIEATKHYSIRPVFNCKVLDQSGDTVAEVEKTLYVRRKDAKKG